MLSPDVYYPGTRLVIYMPLPLGEQKKICMLSGVVLRAEPIEQSFLRGYGVRFDREIPPASRKVLQEFVGEKGAPPAREEAPVARAQTYVRLATWGKRIRELDTGKHLASGVSARWQRVLWKVLMVVVIGVGGVKLGGYIYRGIHEPMVISRLSEVMPFQKGEFVANRLSLVMPDEWIKLHTLEQKRAGLADFAKALRAAGVYEAVLLDKEKRTVALILRSP